MRISTKADLVSLAFMVGLYGALFLYLTYLDEPITVAGLGAVLILLGVGSFVIISQREKTYRRLQTLLGTYATQYGGGQE